MRKKNVNVTATTHNAAKKRHVSVALISVAVSLNSFA